MKPTLSVVPTRFSRSRTFAPVANADAEAAPKAAAPVQQAANPYLTPRSN